MISNSIEAADFTPKQEDHKTSEGKISKAAAASSSSTSWSRLRDPRIVRVSRAFGGKDRHSKVCTVRGLRDRRIRLSVPTAIQLYDLQDRLGLNQPSKVIDWLLSAAKDEIDELPPLQMPPGNFFQIHHPMSSTNSHGGLIGHDSQSAEKSERQLNINNWNHPLELSASNYWSTNSEGNLRDHHMKSKEIVEERDANDKQNWTKRKQGDPDQDHDHAYISSNNFITRANLSNSLTGLLNNVMPVHNSSFLRWDSTSNLSLSQTEDHPHQNFNFVPILPSTSLSMPSGSHQFVVYPPAREFDPKHMINFQMLNSTNTSQNSPLSNSSFSTPPLYTINQAMRPFHLSMNPYDGTAPTKDD